MTTANNRSASERVFSNRCNFKTGAELKKLMHMPESEADPPVNVRRNSLVSLRNWAEQRKFESKYELQEPQASYEESRWCGFIAAIDEIFQMEVSNGRPK